MGGDSTSLVMPIPKNGYPLILCANQIQTEQGRRIRLKTPSVTIEAVRLRVKSEGKIYEMEIGTRDNPSIITRSYQDGVIGVSAEPASKAAEPRK